MCRSSSEPGGPRRCPGSRSQGGGSHVVTAGSSGDMSPQMARLLGTDTPEGAARFERLSALRDSGYTGPVDQDGNAVTWGPERRRDGQFLREAREDRALDDMKAEMRKWRSLPVPDPGPAEPMDPGKARLLGCDTPEGRAKFDRLRAYREAGYHGPLDKDNNIPDPDSPTEQQTLSALAGLSLTHS